MKKIISVLLALLAVAALFTVSYAYEPQSSAILTTGEGGEYVSSCGIEQKFSVDVDRHYIDVSTVKVEWEISGIEVEYESYKTWNTKTLEWDEVKSSAEITAAVAEFTLTNYSSVAVRGTVGFTPSGDEKVAATYSEAVITSNALVIGSMVESDHSVDEAKKTSVPSNTISVALQFNKDKFLELDDAEDMYYGLYTVTVEEVKPD